MKYKDTLVFSEPGSLHSRSTVHTRESPWSTLSFTLLSAMCFVEFVANLDLPVLLDLRTSRSSYVCKGIRACGVCTRTFLRLFVGTCTTMKGSDLWNAMA